MSLQLLTIYALTYQLLESGQKESTCYFRTGKGERKPTPETLDLSRHLTCQFPCLRHVQAADTSDRLHNR